MSGQSEAKRPRGISDSFQSSKDTYSHDHAPAPSNIFWMVFGLSQALGLAIIGMIVHWCRLYGGFSWTDDKLQFSFHPLFMFLGLVFFYGDAIIIYRVLSFLPKIYLKIIHTALHCCAIISSIVGLVAVLEYHRKTIRPDFYSLHSWIGISAFGLFCFQYIGGFVTFLYPGLPNNWRAKAMPFHTSIGTGLFILGIVAVQTGFTEKLLWTDGYTVGAFNEQAVIGNILGIAVIVFAFLILFIVTHASYKRRPLPNEVTRTNAN